MIHTITIGLALLLITAALVVFNRKRRGSNQAIDLANNALIVNTTPKGRTTAVADAAFTSRYLIAKRGAYSYSIAMAGQGDTPYGVVTPPGVAPPALISASSGPFRPFPLIDNIAREQQIAPDAPVLRVGNQRRHPLALNAELGTAQ